jgi:hypothetical protein
MVTNYKILFAGCHSLSRFGKVAIAVQEVIAMALTFQVKTTVLPGNRIEIRVPELTEGRSATVLVLLDDESTTVKRRLSEVLGNYAGRQLFQSAAEVDAYLQAEREAWDK